MQYFGVGFLVLLFLEVMSIVWVADWLGGGITLFLMIASFALGLFMLRRVGLSGVMLAAAAMREGGHVSLYQMLWPIRYTVSGVLLMSPGFVSSLIAAILLLPLKGVSMIDAPGQPFYGPEEDAMLFTTLKENITNPLVEVVEIDAHINDSEFSSTAAKKLLELIEAQKV